MEPFEVLPTCGVFAVSIAPVLPVSDLVFTGAKIGPIAGPIIGPTAAVAALTTGAVFVVTMPCAIAVFSSIIVRGLTSAAM